MNQVYLVISGLDRSGWRVLPPKIEGVTQIVPQMGESLKLKPLNQFVQTCFPDTNAMSNPNKNPLLASRGAICRSNTQGEDSIFADGSISVDTTAGETFILMPL